MLRLLRRPAGRLGYTWGTPPRARSTAPVLRRCGVAAAFAVLAALVAAPYAAADAGIGLNRPKSPDSAVSGVGFGKGWVGVMGSGDGPIQGYLFFYDGDANWEPDYASIWDPSPALPYAYAYGQYNGCARLYGKTNLYWADRALPVSNCTVPGQSIFPIQERHKFLYCTNPVTNRFCSPEGAYAPTRKATAYWQCPAYGNVGAQMFRGSPTGAIPKNLLYPAMNYTKADVGVSIRYVTKDGGWALVAFPPGYASVIYPDMTWGFIPTVCLY